MAEMNMIRVRARPPFPHLRPGLDINRSRRRPFTTAIVISLYKNFSVKRRSKQVKIFRISGQQFQNWQVTDFRTKFGSVWVSNFRTGKMKINGWFREKRIEKIGN